MTIHGEDVDTFEFTQHINTDSYIRCESCKKPSPIFDWSIKEISYEVHNDVIALMCPNCGYYHPNFNSIIEVSN